MNASKFYSLIIAGCFALQAIATQRTVNNFSPSPGQYATVTLAIAASLPGDTLLLAGTGINYGSFTVDKQLTIIGPGWTVNGGGYSGNAQASTILMSTLSAAGSKFMGFRFFQLNSSDAPVNIFTNLTIQRCIIDDCLFLGNDDWSGCLIEGNVFTSPGPNSTGNASTSNIIGSTIRNNIFNGVLFYATTNLISQNLFLGNTNGNTSIIASATSNSFVNNIVIGRNCNTIDVTSTVNGNITYSCLNPNLPGTGNFPSTDPMFVSYSIGLYNWTHDYHLGVGSPGIGSGALGYDIGVYGGDGIYRKDGEPDIPVMKTVTVAGGLIQPANSTVTVTVVGVTHE